MTCFSPLQGYRSSELSANGKRKIVFSAAGAYLDRPVSLPCGQCVGCRLERSRQWAIRCMHEASLYEDNCFITLTYSDEHLPADGSLQLDHFQKFMKRLRKRFDGLSPVLERKVFTPLQLLEYERNDPFTFHNREFFRDDHGNFYFEFLTYPIRFFHCGEYGEKFGRPHYHALLFNFDFPDKVLWKEDNGQKLYRSKTLEDLWPFGHCSVGSATFESAAYVARYIMKKVTGDLALTHYADIDLDTGEILSERTPEYTTMSRRPGIGKKWFDKFKSDVYPKDEVVVIGRGKMRPPKYYDAQFELLYPAEMENIKAKRIRGSKKFADNNTPERLAVRKKCKELQIAALVRNVDKVL